MTGDSTESIVQSDRVTLTPLQIKNIYRHFEWNNDKELNRFDSDSPVEEEPFREFKQRFERMVFDPLPNEKDFEIHAEDDTLLGVAFVGSISPYNKSCRIGLTIGERSYWGKGYGRETLELLLDYCFNELKLHRVATETFEYNASWNALVINSGFVKEGVERDAILRDEEYWDKILYSMLEDEYRVRRTSTNGRAPLRRVANL